jgi:hypothetical protein
MENWQELDDVVAVGAWNFIFIDLKFSPYIYGEKISVNSTLPKTTFDISKFYNSGFSEQAYEDLHRVAIFWFKDIAINGKIFALKWQQSAYSFTPFLPFELDEFGEWLVPLFPNGDFEFFLSPDFSNGIFADGINFKITFWGSKIIDSLKINFPMMFEGNEII